MKKQLLFEIKSLENAVARTIFHDAKRNNMDSPPTPMQERITLYLVENQDKEVYQKDLESILKVRKSSISGVLKTMEKKGIIKRIDAKKDGRAKQIILTEEAKQVHKEADAYFEQLELRITQNIPQEKLAICYEVIAQMIKNIEGE